MKFTEQCPREENFLNNFMTFMERHYVITTFILSILNITICSVIEYGSLFWSVSINDCHIDGIFW